MVDSFWCAASSVAWRSPVRGGAKRRKTPLRSRRPRSRPQKRTTWSPFSSSARPTSFPDDRLADEGELAPPFDLAPRSHAADLMVGVVPRVFEAFRHGPRRGRVEIGRQPLPERFVRALFIIVSAELIEAGLLLPSVGGGRLRGLLLQRTVHPLMTPVLLRRGGANEVRFDAEGATTPKAASVRLPLASQTAPRCRSGLPAAGRRSRRRA